MKRDRLEELIPLIFTTGPSLRSGRVVPQPLSLELCVLPNSGGQQLDVGEFHAYRSRRERRSEWS
jgi:hypothetical protein